MIEEKLENDNGEENMILMSNKPLKNCQASFFFLGWLWGCSFVSADSQTPPPPVKQEALKQEAVKQEAPQPIAPSPTAPTPTTPSLTTPSTTTPSLDPIIGPWFLDDAKEYKNQLESLHKSPLQAEKRSKVKARIKENLKKKELPIAVADQEFLAGAKDATFQDWFQLALLLKESSLSGGDRKFELRFRAQKASYCAYILGKTPEEKAAALLLMASTYVLLTDGADEDGGNTAAALYDLASQISSLSQVRKRFPETRSLMPFRFEKFQLDNEGDAPKVCFLFSGGVKTEKRTLSDYIQISPKVDSQWYTNGRQICTLNLKFGSTYKAVLKKGLPAFSGEALAEDEVISFKATNRSPRLSFTPQAYVLMKGAKGGVPLSSINVDKVHLKILRINDRFLASRLNLVNFLQNPTPFHVAQIEKQEGQLLWTGTMEIVEKKNESVTTEVPFLQTINTLLPGIYLIAAQYSPLFQQKSIEAYQWVVVTDLGISAFSGVGGLEIFIRSLATAKPTPGVKVRLIARNNQILAEGKTDQAGRFVFDPGFLRGKGGQAPLAIYAYESHGDFSVLTLKGAAFDLSDRGAFGREMPKEMDAFLYTERGVYRPGEKIHAAGLLRNMDAVAVESFPLTLKLLRPDGVAVQTDIVKTNTVGAFTQDYDLGKSARTGRWSVLAYTDPEGKPVGSVEFYVEDFIPARLDFSLNAHQPFLRVGKPTEIMLTGRYLFGAPAAGLKAEAQVTLRRNPAPFPFFAGYIFGLEEEPFDSQRHVLAVGPTDSLGKVVFPLLVPAFPDTTHPVEAGLQVSLFEVGGRPTVKTMRFPLVKKTLYLGIKPLFSERTADKPEALFNIVVLNEQGVPQKAAIDFELFKEEMHYTWYQKDASSPWAYKAAPRRTPLRAGHLFVKAEAPESLEVSVPDWGAYRLILRDSQTGAASSFQFYRGWASQLTSSTASPDSLLVRLDKQVYRVGDSVQVQIKAPFEGEGQLLVMNDKILENHPLSIPTEGRQISLKAAENWGTGVYIVVTAYRPLTELPSTLYPQAKRALGLAWAGMDLEERRLHVDVRAPEKMGPRQTLFVTIGVGTLDKIKVKKPAEKVYLTLAAVDEGILSLTDFKTPSPLEYFLGKRRLGVEIRDLYGQLIETEYGALGTLKTGGSSTVVRDFSRPIQQYNTRPLALFSGFVVVDQSGSLTLPLKIPDFNGKIRLMAVAFTADRYGSAERSVLVQDPLVLEISTPRFLAPQDQATVTFSLHCMTEKKADASSALEAKGTGSLRIKGPQTIPLNVKGQEGVYGKFDIAALEVGEGQLHFSLKGADFKTEKDFSLPVRSAIPPLMRHRIEKIDVGSQKIFPLAPLLSGLREKQSTLFLTITSQLPWDMTLLLKSLGAYSYGGVEELVSKVFPLLYIENLQVYLAELKDLDKVKGTIEKAVLDLIEQQSARGDFSWGMNSEVFDLWLTSYVLDFWISAKMKGYTVPDFAIKKGLGALDEFIRHSSQLLPEKLPALAYAFYILAKAQHVDIGQVRYFYETYGDQLKSPLAMAHVATALALLGDLSRAEKAFEKSLAFFTSMNPQATAGTQATAGEKKITPAARLDFGSVLRDGAAIITLIYSTTEKASYLAPLRDKIAPIVEEVSQVIHSRLDATQNEPLSSLLSIQEESWLAIAGHFLKETLASSLSLIVGDQIVSQTGQDWTQKISGSGLPEKPLVVKNNGKAPVWLMMTADGIPLKEIPISQGISLERRFYLLNGKEIALGEVSQNTQLVVVLSGKILTERSHRLLFVDLLPAGCEIENAHLGQGSVTNELSWLKDLSNAQRTELRDDRYVAEVLFPPEMREFKLAYIVRAITPGAFTYPASLVEDIHVPYSFFCRTTSGKMTIVPSKATSPAALAK